MCQFCVLYFSNFLLLSLFSIIVEILVLVIDNICFEAKYL